MSDGYRTADAHLHVSWQKRIGEWLKQHFPRIDVCGLHRFALTWARQQAFRVRSCSGSGNSVAGAGGGA